MKDKDVQNIDFDIHYYDILVYRLDVKGCMDEGYYYKLYSSEQNGS